MRIWFKAFRRNKISIIMILVFMIITSAISLILPTFLAYILSQAIPNQQTIGFIIICFTSLLLVSLESFVSKNLYMLVTMLQSSVTNKLRIEYIKSAVNIGLYNQIEIGVNLNQINQVANLISYSFVKLVIKFIVGVGAGLYLLAIAPVSAVLFSCLLPVSYRKGHKLLQVEAINDGTKDIRQLQIIENINRLVKNANLYKLNLNIDYQLEKVECKLNLLTEKQLEKSTAKVFSANFSSIAAVLGVLFFGLSALSGKVTFYQYLIAIQYIGLVLIPVSLLATSKSMIETALDSYEHISGQIKNNNKGDKIFKVTFDRIGSIQFVNPNYQQRVKFDCKQVIKRGQVYYLKAPSGSGKSAILQMLLKLQPIDDGEILINNIDIKQIRDEFIWGHTYYASQDIKGFNGTILDNILIGSNANSQDLQDYVEKYQLQALTKDLKWRKMISNFDQLSLEERKQIQIFKLLVADKDVYILDELEATLDSNWIEKLEQIITDKAQHAIVIRTQDSIR